MYCQKKTHKQVGATLLVLMLLMVLVLASTLVVQMRDRPDERRDNSRLAIATARQALLAWSLSREGTAGGRALSPAELPCPAAVGASGAFEGVSITSCDGSNAANRIGLLPWKTLGIPKLLDGAGQPLWYVVDLAFAVRSSATQARRVNSDSFANLSLYAADGVTQHSDNGQAPAALIFAAGPALSHQVRAAPWAVNQYLEGGKGQNNATLGGPYIAAAVSETFNDQVGVITGRELIDRTTHRLALEAAAQLKRYWQAYQIALPSLPVSTPASYPYPANLLADASCRNNKPDTTSLSCASQANLCAGILPRASDSWTGQGMFPLAASNGLAQWFLQNIWHRAIFYAVKQGDICAAPFVIDGVVDASIEAILIIPGASRVPRANNLAPSPSLAANASSDLALYLDDSQNQTHWLNPLDRQYVSPSCSSNDVLYLCRLGVCSARKKTCS
ncbi:hypothetical protein [Deefgea piscis]|uniref:hypothetical protein n=1 Tax=Deefgea piscis TaxID=2739061 RepID=UPI001C7FED2B|nr:hypothetical protein [Deefgea piscis]QZA81841.1 hypothetical protein K4H25_04070 [Deefgea piscis]